MLIALVFLISGAIISNAGIAKEGTQSGVSFFINFKEDFCL